MSATAKAAAGQATDKEAPTPTQVSVEPLTEARFEDLAALFMQGGDPKWCWCMYFRKNGPAWGSSTA